jgi:hypothetical protein
MFGRRGIVELKASYYRQAERNIESVTEVSQKRSRRKNRERG